MIHALGARLLLCSSALLCLFGGSSLVAQVPIAPAATAAPPARDPVTVRGCLDKRWLRILQHDATDLSGVRRVRLKGSRAMLESLDDGRGAHVEITGDLDLGRRDRLETRRKRQIGSKTTVSLGASAEQVRSPEITPDVTLIVESFTRLGDQCPSR